MIPILIEYLVNMLLNKQYFVHIYMFNEVLFITLIIENIEIIFILYSLLINFSWSTEKVIK